MSDRADDLLGAAYKIAKQLETEGRSGPDGMEILSIALGIFAEGQDGGSRNLEPLRDGMLKAAQIVFDALRASRSREPGNA